MKYVACIMLLLSIPQAAIAAGGTLRIAPERGTFFIGEPFTVHIFADSPEAAISAAEAEVLFSPTALTVTEVSTEGSIITSWLTPPSYSNEHGRLSLSGSMATPFVGENGLLLTIIFMPERTMSGSVEITGGTLLSADGKGSNLISTIRQGVFSLGPKRIVAVPERVSEPETANASLGNAEEPSAPVRFTPVLYDYPVAGSVGERVVIKGSATPDTDVVIWLEEPDQRPREYRVASASDGSFTFASDDGMREGNYRAWAEAIGDDGSRGDASRIIAFTVRTEDDVSQNAAAVGLLPTSVWGMGAALLVVSVLGTGVYVFLRSYPSVIRESDAN